MRGLDWVRAQPVVVKLIAVFVVLLPFAIVTGPPRLDPPRPAQSPPTAVAWQSPAPAAKRSSAPTTQISPPVAKPAAKPLVLPAITPVYKLTTEDIYGTDESRTSIVRVTVPTGLTRRVLEDNMTHAAVSSYLRAKARGTALGTVSLFAYREGGDTMGPYTAGRAEYVVGAPKDAITFLTADEYFQKPKPTVAVGPPKPVIEGDLQTRLLAAQVVGVKQGRESVDLLQEQGKLDGLTRKDIRTRLFLFMEGKRADHEAKLGAEVAEAYIEAFMAGVSSRLDELGIK